MALLKTLRVGHDFSLKSSAVCFYLLEQVKDDLRPDAVRPLIPITGGMSMYALDQTMSSALFAANDWIFLNQDNGASIRNAIIGLAANYDTYIGMVAFALEMAQVALKDSNSREPLITAEEYVDVMKTLYLRDWAGLYTRMSRTWGMVMKDGTELPEPVTTARRSMVAAELGHDVLIHPITLRPCADAAGVLEFTGLETEGDEAYFAFVSKSGERIRVAELLPDIAL